MDKLSPREYGLSTTTLEIIVTCSTYSCTKNHFDSFLLNEVMSRGYVELKGDYLKLTNKGKSLYDKLLRCVVEDLPKEKL